MVRPELDDTATLAPSPGGPASAPADQLPAGLRLGHFRIERRLGAGGMGEVYLATDLALDRPVAVKVLPAGVASGVARDRLVREARAQARVHHPNVAHIYFIGEDAGRLYFAMELLGGKTLAELAPMRVEDALAMIRGATLGLREAQRSGFTHRDVKPSNLMLDGHGVIKVLDFGLAHGSLTPGRASDGPVAQTTLAGTPLYMAPEQARGEPIDLRADIYALGATLFHLVAGKPPFEADSVDQLVTLHATARRPPLPRGANPRTQIAAIDMLIAKMMAPEPKDRFASYDELLRAIEAASLEHSRPAGFWVRCIASGVDLLFVTALAAAVSALYHLTTDDQQGMGFLVLPAGLVYAIVAIGRWGTTIGKALFELEVASHAAGGRPTWRQAIAREGVLVGPMLIGTIAERGLAASGVPDWLGALVSLLGVTYVLVAVGLLLRAALQVPGKRAPWDLLSGTSVRYRRRRQSEAL